MSCEHHYEHQGRVTWCSTYSLPGSGAHSRIYADAFYCVKCADLKLTNEQEIGNTYEKVLGDAVQYKTKPV